MSIALTAIWRHPIKGHGRESLSETYLTEGQTLPWDRRWAVANEVSQAQDGEWARCANFTRGASTPALMAITSTVDETSGHVTLSHPDRPDLAIDPARDQQAFLEWIRPLMSPDRAMPAKLITADERGMTDSSAPTISILNMASHRDLEAQMGRELSTDRWRINLHLDGAQAWEEFNWVGQTLRVGEAEFSITKRIDRCLATHANTVTGERDVDILGALNQFYNHEDFGVFGVVTKSGRVATGDTAVLL